MLDHYSIPVSDFKRSKSFYDKTLALLGYECVMDFEVEDVILAGYGKNGKPSFWIGQPKRPSPKNGEEFSTGFINGLHIGFLAPNAESVDQWYKACLAAGGKCHGKPGKRPYHDHFYGAFVIDPDGWKVEACIHDHNE